MVPKRVLVLTCLVVITACGANSVERNVPPKPETARAATARESTEPARSSHVSLRITEQTRNALILQLWNETDHPIFVSYVPPKKGTETTFVGYSLERSARKGNNFSQYGEGFHFVPNLHPINPRSALSFRLTYYPTEGGDYRVRVGYYEDEDVYEMISQRLLEMTDAERKRADQTRKYVFSDSFFVTTTRRKK